MYTVYSARTFYTYQCGTTTIYILICYTYMHAHLSLFYSLLTDVLTSITNESWGIATALLRIVACQTYAIIFIVVFLDPGRFGTSREKLLFGAIK